MKLFYSVILVFVAGCIGDAALPIVSTTRIPNSRFSVHLGGPDRIGNYHYYVTTSNGRHFGARTLGTLQFDQIAPVSLDSLGEGIYRIEWGKSTPPTYAILDVKKKLFVEDSNQANPKNESFLSD